MKIHESYSGQKLNKRGEIAISEVSVTYVQDADSNSPDDEVQELIVARENAGGGDYITISTTRWSINDVDELIAVLEDFKTRFPLQKYK